MGLRVKERRSPKRGWDVAHGQSTFPACLKAQHHRGLVSRKNTREQAHAYGFNTWEAGEGGSRGPDYELKKLLHSKETVNQVKRQPAE